MFFSCSPIILSIDLLTYCPAFYTWIFITSPCYTPYFFFLMNFASLLVVLILQLLTGCLKNKKLKLKHYSATLTDDLENYKHISQRLKVQGLHQGPYRMNKSRIYFTQKCWCFRAPSDSAAPLTQISLIFPHRGGAAQPPGSSDQRDLQRPHSAPGAGAGAGQAVRRDPALHTALWWA